ncbi:protein abnormal spindle [Uranotaenia lowii]|uniref:protein abnormal spindle n=1 Tax=Uranotaenia lowii TaxID=190385 RepID=UPI00247A79D2|nr:protein abnormal spindle [Uranotaenia lowii]
MSAFEVNITPTRVQAPIKRRTESREPTLVQLGPFTPRATVIFDGVPVGKTARRQLVVKNPYDETIKVLVTRIPRPEFCLGLEWTSYDIPPQGEQQMELVWNPNKIIANKEVIQISDTYGNRKDVTVILKSIELKKVPLKKPGSKPTPIIPKKLKLKSPSPPKASLKRNILAKKKESPLSKGFHSTASPSRAVHATKGNVLRLNTGSNIFSTSAFNFSQVPDTADTDKSNGKENISPVVSENVSRMFDTLKFTPSNNGGGHNISYLADLPTPVNYLNVDDFRLDKTNTVLRKRLSLSPELNHGNIMEQATTPQLLNVHANQSYLAMKETPKTANKIDSIVSRGAQFTFTSHNKDSIVQNANVKQRLPFGTTCHSSVTRTEKTYVMPEKCNKDTERQLNFSYEIELAGETFKEPSTAANLKDEGPKQNESDSPCNEIQLVFLNDQNSFPEAPKTLNKTRTVSPYPSSPQLSMIAEESTRELGVTYHSETVANATTAEEREELRIHQKTFKVSSHESLMKSSSDDNILKNTTIAIQRAQRASQGSMPNLHDDEDAEARMMFKEHEIRAQSSRFNLNEISRISDEMSLMDMRKSTKRTSTDSEKDEPMLLLEQAHISPPKRSKFSTSASLNSLSSISTSTTTSTSIGSVATAIGKKMVRGLSSSGATSCFQVPKVPRPLSLKRPPANAANLVKKFPSEERRVFLYDSEHHLKTLINPDPFAATTTCDPFLTATMYLDERAFEKYERQLKKWLNALVTIPADLDTEPNKPLDVGKLFDEVKGKQLTLAPTKELISRNYYRNRLDQLRNAGISLYLSECIAEPLRKVRSAIEKKLMTLRTDRDLHLDLVLQRSILELLLCFNPLWLRLGLEVIFGEQIDLQSNRDVIGLSAFIVNRLFRDRYLEAKSSKAYSLSPAYAEHMKKFTFRMFLFLMFFLDTAKNRRLIKHNPCLFVKNAPYKETREILIRFSSLLIAGIGDITKHLKRFGYVLQHKQTFLDEFDYAFENLAVDLRDGIRLTRVMEIILLRDDISQNLRVPSISRLQKVHNVNLALKALEEADYQITGDITAKDVCDGHREKTLSLLWQIVYKFRSPKFKAAANSIRNWWKRNWLKVVIARRIEEKRQKRREIAALKIQSVYRMYRARQQYLQMREHKLESIVILQKYTRRYLAQKNAAQQYSAILRIQRWWLSIQQVRVERDQFLLQRKNAIVIQSCFRRYALSKRLLSASIVIRQIRDQARLEHSSAVVIQRSIKSWFIHRKLQSIVMGIVAFNKRKLLRNVSATKIQATYRRWQVRSDFLRRRSASILIQRRWRECLMARVQRTEFLLKRQSAIFIQTRFRALLLMRQTMASYEKQRDCIIFAQRKYRAKLNMRQQRKEYIRIKESAIVLQQRYRALQAMREIRKSFVTLKLASIVVQQRFRARIAMQKDRNRFLEMKNAVITIQQRFRAQVAMKKNRSRYLQMQTACITIQQHFRATVQMKLERLEFLALQYHSIVVQRHYRAKMEARKCRTEYFKLKTSTILIQQKWRATLLARETQQAYRNKRDAIIKIQHYWRTVQIKRRVRENYLEKRTAAITIQRYFRNYILTRNVQKYFQQLRAAVVKVQRRYRATKLMLQQRQQYQNLSRAAATIQKHYHALLVGRQQRAEYLNFRNTTIAVQRRWRAILSMRKCRMEYQKVRQAVIILQTRYRALMLMRSVRTEYTFMLSKVVFIQQKYRAKRDMERVCGHYLNLKSATIIIQQYYRGCIEMKQQRSRFQNLRNATICLQRRFRANRAMELEYNSFQRQRYAAIRIQRRFREYLVMKKTRQDFLQLKTCCIVLQNYYRARLAMISKQRNFQTLKSTVIKIQHRWRATLAMRKEREQYKRVINAVTTIQVRYRAYRMRLTDQITYRLYRSAVIIIQRRYRAKLATRQQQARFQQIKTVTFGLQTRARGFLARQAFQAKLTPEYLERRTREKAAKCIQARWRGYIHRKRYQTKPMQDVALRMVASRQEAARDPSNRVSNILNYCMKFMKTRFVVHEAIKVLQRIEQISRLVPHLLEPDAIFLATFCYGTMAQAIRSELDKQLIEICARIILNMARFEGTKEEAFRESGLVTVSQMLLRWCDKECGIFNTLCSLLWVLSHDVHKKNAIRRYMISREAIFMLRETKKLVQRKENMRKNVKKPVGCLVPPDPSLMRMVPCLAPDYGVIRSKPYVFYSSVFAFDTVLSALDVDIS